MRARMGWLGGLVTGLVGGIMLVVACSDSGPGAGLLDGGLFDSGLFDGGLFDGGIVDAGGDAQAQTTGCDTWEIVTISISKDDPVGDLNGYPIYRMPDGWEPVNADPSSSNYVPLRRCVD